MVVITCFPPPTDDIRHKQPSTKLCINSKEVGIGTLYIAERRLAWVEDTSLQQGYSIEYKNVSLHAISRDLQAFPEECLYVMLDLAMESPQEANGDADEEGTEMTELRFIPEDKGCLDAMFQAMSHCQTLHPDTDNSFSSDGKFIIHFSS
ncbi:hypothetical protein AAG570_001491 [Ranatra chinensis]|uniref:Methylosome subunit pICln n=1 Tax=Ranatra chinensis TaxID=642074 RepID=A0ABD0YRA5_9HEMI